MYWFITKETLMQTPPRARKRTLPGPPSPLHAPLTYSLPPLSPKGEHNVTFMSFNCFSLSFYYLSLNPQTLQFCFATVFELCINGIILNVLLSKLFPFNIKFMSFLYFLACRFNLVFA
jgi:hypothetical protein